GHSAIEHLIPEGDPRGAALETVEPVRRRGEQVGDGRGIELEPAVTDTVAGREHEERRPEPGSAWNLDPFARELHVERRRLDRDVWTASQADQYMQPLVPVQAATANGVTLHERQARDAAVGNLEVRSDLRPSGFVDPGEAPGRQI